MGSKQAFLLPRLQSHLCFCARCGYPLAGINAPGPCPECGLGFDDDCSTLVLTGVAKTTSDSKWRRVGWVALGALAFFMTQGGLVLIVFKPWLGALLLATLAIGLTAMLLTTRQKRRGVEHFVLTRRGLSRWTLGSDPTTRYFIEWFGNQRLVRLKRVSSVWASLEITCVEPAGRPRRVLVAGIRCRAQQLSTIESIANAIVLDQPLIEAEGLEAFTSENDTTPIDRPTQTDHTSP